MYRNNDFIYDAAVRLEECIAMPVTIESTRVAYDAVLTINKHQFTVATKAEIRTANKGIVLAQLKELETKTSRPIIVIAKFIASDIAKEFKEKTINYLDIAGNAFIKNDNLFINVTGQKVQKMRKPIKQELFRRQGLS